MKLLCVLALSCSVLATPSVLGATIKDVYPALKVGIDAQVATTIHDVSAAVMADIEEEIAVTIGWVPLVIRSRMQTFIHSRITSKIGAMVTAQITRKITPKLDDVLDEVKMQILVLDNEIDMSLLDIRNKVRKVIGDLPPLKSQ